jgi:hypothetical protein
MVWKFLAVAAFVVFGADFLLTVMMGILEFRGPPWWAWGGYLVALWLLALAGASWLFQRVFKPQS